MEARIKKIISFSGLNKKDFAYKIGITPNGLYNYLHKGRVPNIETLLKIKELIPELSIEWVVTGEGSMLKKAPDIDTNSSNSTNVDKIDIATQNQHVMELLKEQLQEKSELLLRKEDQIQQKDTQIQELTNKLITLLSEKKQ